MLDAVFWYKIIVGIVWGIAWGLVGLKGLYSFGGYMSSMILLQLFWHRQQQYVDVCVCAESKCMRTAHPLSQQHRVEEDDYGGLMALLQEGFAQSIALFLVSLVHLLLLFTSMIPQQQKCMLLHKHT